MTKKLFVVLVVISALLITFSFVIAAKKAPRGIPEPYVKRTIGQQQTATPMPRGSLTQPLEALPLANPISTSEARADKIPGYGPPQHSYEGVLILQGGEDCATATVISSLPHTSTGTTVGYADDYEVMDGVGCPYSSTSPDVVYSYAPGADEVIDIDLGGSSYDTKLFVYEDNCVNPAYACDDDYYPDYTSAIMELDIYTGHTYYIVVDGYGGDAGEYLLNVSIFEPPPPCSVVCPDGGIDEGEPVCYDEYDDQYNGGCNTEPTPVFQDVNCGDILCGTSGTFLMGADNYRDTDWYRVVVAEDGDLSWKVVAEFPVLIFIIDAGTENCVDYTILGSSTANECDTVFLSFPVTAGVYWLWVGPSVFSGVDCGVEYVGWVGCAGGGPENQCDLQHDNGSAASFFDLWVVGDEEAAYFDPATECVDCDPVYPLHITEVQGYFYDFASAGILDVIVHFYEAGAPCDGPGAEIYSFAATVTDFYPASWATLPLPDLLCLEDDFFLAIEYNSGTEGSIPSLLFDTGAPVDTCIQWNYRGGGWIEWWDFWATPSGVGWLMLRAVGTCADLEACYPGEECDLVQDPGVVNYYFSGFAAGDVIAKYFDPEDALFECTPPVYPYRIADVEFDLYDFGGMGAVDVIINVELECQDACDGPGVMIYQSDPITVTTFHPNLAHIDLPEVVCVYEPFFITIEYATGAQGSTPSFVWSDESYPCDTCHAWLYYASGGYPFWMEWHDFWSPPAGGCPIIRVSGYTESPDCDIPSCDTTIEMLAGGLFPAYFWKQPPNDAFLNMRFEMPVDHGGRLEYFNWANYEAGTYGTPNPDFYVWLSDGIYPLDNNPPYQAIADFHIAFGDIVYFPGWTTVQTYPRNLIFEPGEMFHIGVSHAFEEGDTLAPLSDDGTVATEIRFSGWDGTAWGSYFPYEMLLDAFICPFAPEMPTFTMQCKPSLGYATPGDPPVNVYEVQLTSVIGYADNVILSLLSPPAGINATFDPPGGCVPTCTLAVAITVDAGVAYEDYTLTFEAVGDDQQTKICDVTLRVQPPYDEGLVHFFHGYQRTSNFGAIGNANTPAANFVWYDMAPLFDGSIISFAPVGPWEDWDQHIALDVYDCEHVGFIPTQHLVITDDPWCPGSAYEEYYGEIGYSNFYTEEDVISCEYDSLFVVGLTVPDSTCTLWIQDGDTCMTDGWRYIGIDFSIKIKIYYNPYGPDIPEMYAGIFEDWDVGLDWGEMDTLHNIMYQYDEANPSIVFGIMSIPFYDQYCHNMTFIHNITEVYPPSQGGDSSFNCDAGGPGLAYLARLMQKQQYRPMGHFGEGPDDHSVLTVSPPFSLNQGEKHIEIWIDFGRDLNDGMTWEQWYHRVLRYAGFYRGDVNASDTLDLPAMDISDLVYLINYVFKDGPAPLPFADQGNVDGMGPYGVKAVPCSNIDPLCPKENVDMADIVYLLNHVFKGGPPPIDYVRFIEQCWTRPSLFYSPFNVWP